MKKHLSTIMLILVLLVGLSLLLYPTVSDYWNSFHQSQAIASYAEEVAGLDKEKYAHLWNDAKAYNAELAKRENPYAMSDEQRTEYNELLNLGGNGIMGYIEIPEIKCSLPIYHGTDENVLQVAIGHLEWTSLPTGGADTHCVVSGHRGLPSAKLFTDLDQIVEGDLFLLRILDETLTYEVDQILIVDPDDTKALLIEEGKDYCTLVTCTPYGINSHRLLVRGHRVENRLDAKSIRITADALQVDPLIVATAMAIPLLLMLVAVVFVESAVKKKRK